MCRPITTVMTLRCNPFVSRKLLREVYGDISHHSRLSGHPARTFGAYDEEERHLCRVCETF